MACQWFLITFVLQWCWDTFQEYKWIWALLDCLSLRSLNTLWSLRMALATLFGRVWLLLCYGYCACWYLSLVSTFCLHQTSSLHLELFHDIYKQDSLVFQVRVLRYIQLEMAFLATVVYATTGWFMLLILNVFKWFSSQVLHKNTVINLFSSSFQVSRFKDNVFGIELLTLNSWRCFNWYCVMW